MYKLEKYVDGEWQPFGIYSTAQGLATAAYVLGATTDIDQLRVTEVQGERSRQHEIAEEQKGYSDND